MRSAPYHVYRGCEPPRVPLTHELRQIQASAGAVGFSECSNQTVQILTYTIECTHHRLRIRREKSAPTDAGHSPRYTPYPRTGPCPASDSAYNGVCCRRVASKELTACGTCGNRRHRIPSCSDALKAVTIAPSSTAKARTSFTHSVQAASCSIIQGRA